MLRLIENTVHSRIEASEAQAFLLRNNTILAAPSKFDPSTHVTHNVLASQLIYDNRSKCSLTC